MDTGQRNLDADIGLMDYKARFYSAYINRFVQPDTLVPSPANPQAFNRFTYVLNSPINFNDPSGHMCMDPEAKRGSAGCDGADRPGQASHGGGLGNLGGKSGSSNRRGDKPMGDAKEETNPCVGASPPRSEFSCGITITEPSDDMYPIPPSSKIIDDFTDFEWEGKTGFVNGQPITPIATGGSRGIGIVELLLLGIDLLHYNTNTYALATNSYTQGLIPYISSEKTGKTAMVGLGIYNNTGYDMLVTSVIMDKQPINFSAPYTPNDYVGVIDISPMLVPSQTSIDIHYTMNRRAGNVQTTFGYGSLQFSGHIGP